MALRTVDETKVRTHSPVMNTGILASDEYHHTEHLELVLRPLVSCKHSE